MRKLAFVVLLVCGCAESQPEAKGPDGVVSLAARVEVSKAEPPPTCRPLGTAEAHDVAMFKLPSYDIALDRMKAEAARRGANYAVLDAVTQGRGVIQVQARIFGCAPVAAQACAPECSPGYACVAGHCASLCNPACEAGQRCGSDKTCHLVE